MAKKNKHRTNRRDVVSEQTFALPGTVTNLNLFSEANVLDFVSYVLSKKSQYGFQQISEFPKRWFDSPYFSSYKESAYECVKAASDIFNAIPADLKYIRSLEYLDKLSKSLLPMIKRLGRNEIYKKHPAEMQLLLMQFISMIGLDRESETELHDIIRYIFYLPILDLQVKKQRLVIAQHSETGEPIYGHLKIVVPPGEYFSKFIGGDLSDQRLSILTRMASSYFVFPMLTICRIFNENDLDMLPEFWGHTIYMFLRDIPDIGERWRNVLDRALAQRKYVLPDEGVLIECSNYGDIVSITFKEAFLSPSTPVCYAKVRFADGMDDIVIFNPTAKVVLSSGYGDVYGDSDRVMDIVAKAYENLISSRRIHIISPKHRNISNEKSSPQHTGTEQTFYYIPRTIYENSGTSLVRRKANRQSPRPHPVGGHIRKGNPSEAARMEAARYGVVLPEGYTFVKPYQTKGGRSKEHGKSLAKMRR